MPNHVTNILEFDCSKERSREIMESFKADGQGYGTIDFNKIIPMPESLNMTAGSETDHAIEIYLTAVNPKTKDYGYPKLPQKDFLSLYRALNYERVFMVYNDQLNDGEIRKYIMPNSFESYFEIGKQAVDNMKEYGATTWYNWCISNWGSKWSAYDCVSVDPADGYMTFLTAWSSVPSIVQKISERFPDVRIHYSWADEDLGNNTGRREYLAGEEIYRDIPEGGSRHAFEIACDVQGYDIDEISFGPEPSESEKQAKNKNRDAR